MTTEEYWKKPLIKKRGTHCYLKDRPFYYDFNWTEVFPKSKEYWSKFCGLKTVSEIITSTIGNNKWDCVEIILTTGAEQPFFHEWKEGKHYFVFDAIQLQKRRYSATTAFLGNVATESPGLIDAYQFLRCSPEILKRELINSESIKLLESLKKDEAKKLLPMALGFLTEALGKEIEESDANDNIDKSLNKVDFAALVRSLQMILARAISRGDVSSVFAVLDSLSEEQRTYFKNNPEIVKLVAEEDIESVKIISIAYRKAQLKTFEKLLESAKNVDAYKVKHAIEKPGEEPAWQYFFEKNKWIFGLALNFFFNAPISDNRLEALSSGSTFYQHGKRPDGLLATVGIIRSLCFVEIKTPRKTLLGNKYRDDVWVPSDELSGAISQSHQTVHQSIKELDDRFRLKDDEGTEHGYPIYTIFPRSYVIIGNRSEFYTTDGSDKSKMIASFELFRRDLSNPEIITFDELLERAKGLLSNT